MAPKRNTSRRNQAYRHNVRRIASFNKSRRRRLLEDVKHFCLAVDTDAVLLAYAGLVYGGLPDSD